MLVDAVIIVILLFWPPKGPGDTDMREYSCFAFHQTWDCLGGLEVTEAPEE